MIYSYVIEIKPTENQTAASYDTCFPTFLPFSPKNGENSCFSGIAKYCDSRQMLLCPSKKTLIWQWCCLKLCNKTEEN